MRIKSESVETGGFGRRIESIILGMIRESRSFNRPEYGCVRVLSVWLTVL